MNFHDSINMAIGSKTIGACLQLCGYNSMQDFQDFSMDSVNEIEKYVRNVCLTLKRDQRTKYIDNVFVDQPRLFMLTPIVKTRLLNFGKQCVSLRSIGGIFSPSNAENIRPPTLMIKEIEDVKPAKSVKRESAVSVKRESATPRKSITSRNRRRTSSPKRDLADSSQSDDDDDRESDNYVVAGPELHEWVADMARSRFVDCNLRAGEDFQLLRNTRSDADGQFHCRMPPSGKRHTAEVPCFFAKHDKLLSGNIVNHLRSHFVLKSATPAKRPLAEIQSFALKKAKEDDHEQPPNEEEK